jgi:hypothetical protein
MLLVAAAILTLSSDAAGEVLDELISTTLTDDGDIMTTEPEGGGQWETVTSDVAFIATTSVLEVEHPTMTTTEVDAIAADAAADSGIGLNAVKTPVPGTPFQMHGGMVKSTGAVVNSSTSSTVDINGTVLRPSPSNGGRQHVHVLWFSASGATLMAFCVTALVCTWIAQSY